MCGIQCLRFVCVCVFNFGIVALKIMRYFRIWNQAKHKLHLCFVYVYVSGLCLYFDLSHEFKAWNFLFEDVMSDVAGISDLGILDPVQAVTFRVPSGIHVSPPFPNTWYYSSFCCLHSFAFSGMLLCSYSI